MANRGQAISEFYIMYNIIELLSVCSCQKIINVAKLTNFQIGKSKVFLKYWHVDQLNRLMEDVHQAVIMIQKGLSLPLSLSLT